MTKRPRHSESLGKVEGGADNQPPQTPMDRFRALTKGLLNVSRKQLDKRAEAVRCREYRPSKQKQRHLVAKGALASMDYKTERDVEVKLLAPLFSDTLGYPPDQLAWAHRVPMQFGRQIMNKEADLVAKFHGKPVITVEAKSPNEAIQSGLGQLDSYAFQLRTPYSVITNGKRFVLRGYYSFNSRINVIDDAVDKLAKAKWSTLRKLISFENIPATIQEKPNPVIAPDEEKIKDYRRFFRKIHNTIRDRDKLDRLPPLMS